MASITIRKLDDSAKAKLRVRAAQNGRSMEEEARTILEEVVTNPASSRPRGNMAERIRGLFEPLGGVELEIPPRSVNTRRIPDFTGPEYGPAEDE
jgi:plasmid stability protein